MKKVFKVYPSLFILSCNQGNEQAVNNSRLGKGKLNFDIKEVYILKGRPQRYCSDRVNTANALVTLQFTSAVTCSSVIKLSETMLAKLEPITFIGKAYTITYLSVNN